MKIKEQVSMDQLLEHYGVELKRGRAPCPIHGGDNPDAFRITPDKRGYVCSTRGCKGDVVQFVETMGSMDTKEAVEWLEQFAGIDSGTGTVAPYTPAKARSAPSDAVTASEVAPTSPKVAYERQAARTWEYRDKEGNSIFEVRRFNEVGGGPRKICKPYTNGRAGLKDENRTLYNLDKMTAEPEDFIVLVEGEKCAEAVTEAGFIGTTNPMGSGQWKSEFGYGEMLRGRDVLVIPDADDEAEKWLEAVRADLFGKVKSLQVAEMPEEFVKEFPQYKGHDVADYMQERGKDGLIGLIFDMREGTKALPYGVEAGTVVTPDDALIELAEMHQRGDFERLHFNQWIPGLNVVAYASDLVVVMAQTGTGKTRILHNIPFNIRDRNYMMFDLELSRGILGLRYASMSTGIKTKRILEMMKRGDMPRMDPIDHVFLENTGNIDMDFIRDRVHLVEDITQKPIDVIGIDYIGLMKKKGFNSRYGALSEHVESFKGYLNETERTGIISTQCGRSSEGEEGYFKCPSMFAAKDSGSVENSAQLVLRAWRRSPEDRRLLGLNVGKWTHDDPPCDNFDLIADGLRVMTIDQYEYREEQRRQQDMEF